MRLLLASASETRARMLRDAGVDFEITRSAFDEDAAKAGLEAAGFGARDMAELLAERKALAAAAAPDDLVIGADQTLETEDGRLLSKPGSRAELLDQLSALGGRAHRLHSGAVLVAGGARVWGATESVVMTMRPLGEDFLQTYANREYDAVRWNVGGYRIEAMGVQLFSRIEGSYFAILGLPLLPLLAALRERGIIAT